MKVPYSPRGARRGLSLAALGAALWLAWAAGYLQGSRPTEQPSAPDPSTPARIETPAPRDTEA